MRYLRVISGVALAGALSVMSPAAMAACSGLYCSQSQAHSSGYAMLNSVAPAATYSSYSSYSAPTAIADHPASIYAYEGSSAYTSSYSNLPDISSSVSLASSGYSAGYASDAPAGMCPTTCPVSVEAPAGSRVLQCYAACAPEPAPVVTTYTPPPVVQSYRIVRPIIAVPYPVPVMLPSPCGPIVGAPSRYGSSYGYNRCGR